MPSSPGRGRTRDIAVAGLLAALLAASGWVALPLGAVPVTLQTFVVVLAALLLRPGPAAAAIGAYLALGAAGAPVFSGARGGLGVLLGPTGGYLLGFAAGAALGSWSRSGIAGWTGREGVAADAVGAAACVAAVYASGWVWLAVSTGTGLGAAFVAGVAPFVAVDAVKAGAAVAVARALRSVGVVPASR